MGIVHTEIILKNAVDVGSCKRGLMKEQEIRQTTVQALVDTGAATLVIGENLRQQLGLEVQGLRRATLANSAKETVKIVEPVEVHWKNRSMTCQPLVVGDEAETLLGAIPLEDMDLVVDPVQQILTGAHGDEILTMLM